MVSKFLILKVKLQDNWRPEASVSEPRINGVAVTTTNGLYMIGGGQKTKIHPRSVDVMPLTEDKFEVREKILLHLLSKMVFYR